MGGFLPSLILRCICIIFQFKRRLKDLIKPNHDDFFLRKWLKGGYEYEEQNDILYYMDAFWISIFILLITLFCSSLF